MPRPVKKVLRSAATGKFGSTAYLRCNIENGMFNHEKIASFTLGDADISVIVNDQAVHSGRLRVQVYGKKGDTFLIGVPGETFSSSRKMWVNQAQLQLR
jgi:hypothetical protein